MTQIERIIMKRDGLTAEEAKEQVEDARRRVVDGEDPEEILYEEFGLEPDYIFDIL